MSRTVIAAVVAVVIAALTAAAFFVTGTSINDKVKKDASGQLSRAHLIIQQLAQLEAIDVQNKADRLARDPEFEQALHAEHDNERLLHADKGFSHFAGTQKQGNRQPDVIALVGANGDIIAMAGVPSTFPRQWKNEKGDVMIPALDVVLGNRVTISDIWLDKENRMMKMGVAPVLDTATPGKPNEEGVPILGAVVVAYAQTAQEAQKNQRLLGTDVVYYDNNKVISTSFIKAGTSSEEDTDPAKREDLAAILKGNQVPLNATQPSAVTIGGTNYYASAIQMPRAASQDDRVPAKYPPITAGALLLSPIVDSSNVGSTIKIFILVVGVGALAMALLGLYLSHRRLMAQVDQVEQGVTDIINGNVDRTFRPVGLELDGLANGLNVMLARLLGRPEPGEEEFDEEGNPIIPGRVEFEEEDGTSPPKTDPDLAALAQESEPDYYKRVFTEYVAQRKAVGSPDDVSFENFIAKLKVNEGKLKAQFQCRAVRFRVVTKDNKVTLKPVPIFA